VNAETQLRPILIGALVALLACALVGCGGRHVPSESPDIQAAKDQVQREPDSANAWSALGDTYSRHGRVPEALVAYERMRVVSPEHPAASIALARCYRRLGRRSEAVKALRESLALLDSPRLSPTEKGDSYVAIGREYEELGNRVNASRAYRSGSIADPHNGDAFMLSAHMESVLGRHSVARSVYQYVIDVATSKQGKAAGHRGIARDAEATGEISLARDEYRKAIAADATDRQSRDALRRLAAR
jgi:predicted Zn-dependent protease